MKPYDTLLYVGYGSKILYIYVCYRVSCSRQLTEVYPRVLTVRFFMRRACVWQKEGDTITERDCK